MSSIEEIAASDTVLEGLGRGEQVSGDDPVLVALAAWRSDVLDHVDIAPSKRRRWRLAIGVAAASVLVVGFGGVAAAGDARPGSPLWPVTRIVYADRAASVFAEQEAEESLARAGVALAAGDTVEVHRHLANAEHWLTKVRSDRAAQRLRARASVLRDQAVPPGLEDARGSDPRLAPSVVPAVIDPAAGDGHTPAEKPVDKPGDNRRGGPRQQPTKPTHPMPRPTAGALP